MPQTKGQGIVFGIIMSVTMAYGMELYNVAAQVGGMQNKVFWLALKEAAWMVLFVFVLSTLFGNPVARKLAFRHVTPGKDNPFFITLMISGCTVLVMCPTMSLVATVLFHGVDRQFLANWFDTIRRNFPMALLWQIFAAGPVTRWCFRCIFRRQLETRSLVRSKARPEGVAPGTPTSLSRKA